METKNNKKAKVIGGAASFAAAMGGVSAMVGQDESVMQEGDGMNEVTASETSSEENTESMVQADQTFETESATLINETLSHTDNVDQEVAHEEQPTDILEEDEIMADESTMTGVEEVSNNNEIAEASSSEEEPVETEPLETIAEEDNLVELTEITHDEQVEDNTAPEVIEMGDVTVSDLMQHESTSIPEGNIITNTISEIKEFVTEFINPTDESDANTDVVALQQVDPNDIDGLGEIRFDNVGTMTDANGNEFYYAEYHHLTDGYSQLLADKDGDGYFDCIIDKHGNTMKEWDTVDFALSDAQRQLGLDEVTHSVDDGDNSFMSTITDTDIV